MKDSICIRDFFSADSSNEIFALLSDEINFCTQYIGEGKKYAADFHSPQIQDILRILWNDGKSKYADAIASPNAKNKLLEDTLSEILRNASLACAFYGIFTRNQYEYVHSFFSILDRYQVTTDKLREVFRSISDVESDSIHVIKYAMMLLILNMVNLPNFKRIPLFGGRRFISLDLSQSSVIQDAIAKMNSVFLLESSESSTLRKGLQYPKVGIISPVFIDIEEFNNSFAGKNTSKLTPFEHLLKCIPSETVLEVARLLCPFLFGEDKLNGLHSAYKSFANTVSNPQTIQALAENILYENSGGVKLRMSKETALLMRFQLFKKIVTLIRTAAIGRLIEVNNFKEGIESLAVSLIEKNFPDEYFSYKRNGEYTQKIGILDIAFKANDENLKKLSEIKREILNSIAS